MMLHLAVLWALQTQYNGDDYMRPDVRERRLERQEQNFQQEQKWRWEQEQHLRWLDGIQKRN